MIENDLRKEVYLIGLMIFEQFLKMSNRVNRKGLWKNSYLQRTLNEIFDNGR